MTPRELLRAELRNVRDSLAPEFRADASKTISQHLERYLASLGVSCIGSYVATGTEVDLSALHRAWLAAGGVVAVPRTKGAGEMEFVEIGEDTVWRTGRYGILEPEGETIDVTRIEAMLVPGLGFDSKGHRLGYGAGYYDRFLHRLGAEPTRLGICFEAQIVEKVPNQPHDEEMDFVVSEQWRGVNV